MRLSVVLTAYNRRAQLIRTLRSFALSSRISETEVIAVDDASSPGQEINDLPSEFPFLKVLRIEPSEKTWFNPCIPYNRGFRLAQGEVIVLTNAECLHVSDALDYIANNQEPNVYVAYGCYSVDNSIAQRFDSVDWKSPDAYQQLCNIVNPMVMRGIYYDGETAWYQHSNFRANAYHFLSSMTRSDLEDLGGFDERYAQGVAFDDDELLARIRRKGMRVRLVDDPFCVHQWHPPVQDRGIPQFRERVNMNQSLYQDVTLKETGWRANQ